MKLSQREYFRWGQNSTEPPMATKDFFANSTREVYNLGETVWREWALYRTAPTETLYDQRIEEILERVKGIEKMIQGLGAIQCEPETATIEIRDIPYEEAKKEAAAYFKAHHGEKIDASDLQDALGIEIWTAIQICEELKKEGKIAEL